MAAYYNGDMFEAYLTPTKNFQPGATAYNGMKLSRGVLMKNGKKVECAESMGQGLKRFIEWLNNACDDQTGQLILVRKQNKTICQPYALGFPLSWNFSNFQVPGLFCPGTFRVSRSREL